MPVLVAMPLLQQLLLRDAPSRSEGAPAGAWEAFWRWAARHRPLRRLAFGFSEDTTPTDAAAYLQWLRFARPQLTVEFIDPPHSFLSAAREG